ncbi:hypothetical protein FGD67_05065 [Colwellia sp. M166]|uniref:hypothetical protein n=1 Tax=Colwellia sp. M166 TaxID=2583805 RepID=UPI00211DBF3B|nr:hypothetical protein [Colwellia sp. M166]UUO22623.1 hypothetical protein FGD67_05065 [Colwellia sp. M166]|tara:strand:- start:133 stop:435 length:303 start_codon:yes stop_codon:yes gene_type:complete
MDVLTELLPSSYTAKAEPSAKDSRQRQSQAKKSQAKNATKKPHSEDQQMALNNNDLKTGPDNERRAGDDRRLQSMKRGRWLESRDKKDRRTATTDLSLKV